MNSYTVAQSVIVLCMCPKEVATRCDQRVEVRYSNTSWSTKGKFEVETQEILDNLLGMLSMGKVLATAADQEPMYSLDWDAGDDNVDSDDSSKPLPASAPKDRIDSPWPKRMRKRPEDVSIIETKGCSWTDVLNINLMGWSPPVLCDVCWCETV